MAEEGRLGKRQLKRIVKEQSAVVKRDPTNLVARLKLAGALKDLGRNQEAVDHYQAVAKSYADSGKLVQAISVYKGILEIVPDHPDTEAALTALSARRAEEIKRKSMPRLQQVEGRWVMPAEEDVSEEEGTDPGKAAPSAPTGASPSVLRLPVVPPSEPKPSSRRSRRSRSRISQPGPLSPAAAPPVASPGWEGGARAPMPPQPSLPSLQDSPIGEKAVAPAPEASSPRPLPPEEDVPPSPQDLPAAPEFATPADSAQQAERASQEPEVHLTAESPEDLPDSETFEELTSPGPAGYERKIRESMSRLDQAGVDQGVLEQAAREPVVPPGRSTLMGVPLPEHPSLRPGDLVDPSSHVRPTPSVPLPAIRLAADSKALQERAGEAAQPVTEPPGDIPVSRSTAAAPEGAAPDTPAEAAQSDGAGQTRALRKASPAASTPVPGAPAGGPVPDSATLEDVFGDEEDAAWGDLEAFAQEQQVEGEDSDEAPGPTTSQPTLPLKATGARMAPPAHTPPAERPARGTLLMTPVRPQEKTEAQVGAPSPAEPEAEENAPVVLETIPLFRGLSESSRDLLRSRVVVRRESAGTVVVREGEPGNALFVVSEGDVDVTKAGKRGPIHLATLGPGSFFGEFALLSDRRRHATVTVRTDAVLFEISRKVIADLTRAEPAFGTTLRSFYRRRLLSTLLHSAPFFSPLTREEQESLLGKLRFRRLPKGKRIVTQGEKGGGFFLVLVGRLRVTTASEEGKERILARLGDGAYFGEMSLLKGGNAVASVITETPTELLQLPSSEFYRILSKYPQIWEEVNREAKRRELANHQILAGRSSRALATDKSVIL